MPKGKKGPVAPQATTPVAAVMGFDVRIGDRMAHVSAQVLDAAGLQAIEAEAVEGFRDVVKKDLTAKAAAWAAAGIASRLYSALRAGGITDVDAHKRVLKAAKDGGINSKTATPLAKAARGLAAGETPKEGEGYKAFAARCGSPATQGGSGGTRETGNTPAKRAKALSSCVAHLGDAHERAEVGQAPKRFLETLKDLWGQAKDLQSAEEESAKAQKAAKA